MRTAPEPTVRTAELEGRAVIASPRPPLRALPVSLFTARIPCDTLAMPGCIAERDFALKGIFMVMARMPSPARIVLACLAAVLLVVTASQVRAQDKVLRVGTLKLIHGITPYFYEKFAPAGYKIEVVPFESPTDGKNAVLTGTVDTCIHGIAAFLLGAAAGEPIVVVAAATNRGMAIIGDAKSDIKTIKDLRGKRVAIFPGSTQEVVILERLKRKDFRSRTSSRSGCRSAICPRRSPAATSTPMSARSLVPASVSPTASAGSSNTPTRRPIGR